MSDGASCYYSKKLVKFVARNKYYEQSRILNHSAGDLKRVSFMFDVYFSFQWAEGLLAPDLQQGRMRSVLSRRQQTPSAEPWSCTQDTWAPRQHLQEELWDWEVASDSGEPATTVSLVMWGHELCAECWSPDWKQLPPSLPASQALMMMITGESTGSMSWERIASQMNELGFYICKGDSWTYSVIQQMGSWFFFRKKI